MSITVYGIANCDTVKKARAWLDSRGVAYRFHDFSKAGVPAERLAAWCRAVAWDELVNRRGTTWRKLAPARQAAVQDDASARALMSAQPSVIRRPVVEWAGGRTTVGFDAAGWQALAAGDQA